LISSERYFDPSIFGISAQGSIYSNDNKKLQEKLKPSQRIIVQFDSQRSNDITLPIKWLLNEEFQNK
jgi:hypothetical protein